MLINQDKNQSSYVRLLSFTIVLYHTLSGSGFATRSFCFEVSFYLARMGNIEKWFANRLHSLEARTMEPAGIYGRIGSLASETRS